MAGLTLVALPTLLVAGVLCLITFLAGGGLNLSTRTPVEIALTLACGVGIAAAIVLAPADRRVYGAWSAGLLLALAALSALSVIWSVQPDASWQDAGRLFAYSAMFALAVLLARAAPAQWSAVLGGVLLAAVIVCGYALLTKIFPDAFGAAQNNGHVYARLQAPYGYWNAIGLAAAVGAISCMWLGARRAGHALANALAYPTMGLMLVTLLLAYSRGALAALALGLALWLCLVPLRLRGAAVLCVGALGALVVVAWDFSQHALTTDDIPLAERVSAGRQLGVLLVATLVGLTLVGLAIGFLSGRKRGPFASGEPPFDRSGETLAPGEHPSFDQHALSPRTRRRAGTVLLALPVIAAIALAGLLTVSHRGLFGSISHTVSTLTNPNAPLPANGPGRLTAIGSVRARYWNEALEVFSGHPLLGVGAEGYETARLRYRTAILNVGQAHGFVVQTLADLGLVGLLVVLALLGAWMCAAGRATHPFNRRWRRWRWTALAGEERFYSAERVGLLTLVCLVATFGVHSFVDWTWYVPGVACTALLCAGWVAGRGPLSGVLAGANASSGRAPSEVFAGADVPAGLDDPSGGERPGVGHAAVALAHTARRRAAPCRDRRSRRRLRAARGVGAVAATALGGRLKRSARAGRPRPCRGARRRTHRNQPRSALLRSAADARRRPGRRWPSGRCRRHLRARRAPAAVQLPHLAGARRIRPACRPATGRAAGAARHRLPQPGGRCTPRGDRRERRTALDPERLSTGATRHRQRWRHRGADRSRETLAYNRSRGTLAYGEHPRSGQHPRFGQRRHIHRASRALEAPAPRRHQQHLPRWKGSDRSAHGARLDPLEAEILQQRDHRAASVEAQVVGARVEVGRERATREPQRQPGEQLVRGRAQHQRSAGAQHAAHLRQPPGGVRHVLDHLTGPHRVEAHVPQRGPLPLRGDAAQIEARLACAGAAQRLLGDVDPDRLSARPRERRREPALAAAHVQHARTGGDMREQEIQPCLHVRWASALGNLLPQALVIVVCGHGWQRRLRTVRQLRCHLYHSCPKPTKVPAVQDEVSPSRRDVKDHERS